MQKTKSLKIFNNRLALSSGISLLLHLLLLFFFTMLLQLPSQKKSEPASILEVRLAHLAPPKSGATPNNIKLLTSTQSEAFQVNQANVKKSKEVEGVAFPGTIETPFSGQARTSNPFSMQGNISQQQAMRNYIRQSNDAQASQINEQRAQILVLQLQQILSTLLQRNPAVSGKCKLIDTNSGMTQLKCDTPKLFERIRSEERNLVGMLNLLRNMGKIYTGFSATQLDDHLHITFTNENQSQ